MRKFNRESGGRDFRSGGRRFSRRDSGRSNRNFEQRMMHEVTCDECGNKCEVPFKPTEGKPVYCNDCFKRNKSSGSMNKPDQFKKEFDQINIKLDKIIKALKTD